jgi:predicted DNA repair protein MutK
MIGGAYLCFEATEKIVEAFTHHDPVDSFEELAISSKDLENQKVAGAIRTDLILSGEIMAIALAEVADRPLPLQAGALLMVGVLLTVAVYGSVAFIVKMDDIGLHMSRRKGRMTRAIGRGLVQAMPPLMQGLTVIGTAAMLWVGGGILVHGLERYHFSPVPVWVEAASHWAGSAPVVGPLTDWLAFAAGSSVVGVIVGGMIVLVVHFVPKRRTAAPH